MEATNNNNAFTVDEDLSELLDSCLGDFDRPLPKPAPPNPEASTSASSKTEVKDPNSDVKQPDALSGKWGEEFKQLQDVMEHFLVKEGEMEGIKDLMKNYNENELTDLDETFLNSIRDLTQGARNIPDMNPDMLEDLFKDLDLTDPVQPDPEKMPEVIPLVQNLMQRLMSKELLYPSIKDIAEKYPSWLEENRSSLKPQVYERYEQQFKYMKSVCEEFEKECEETEEAKKARFDIVIALMHKIQHYGNPPKDLMAGLDPIAPLDEHGNIQIPGMTDQCSIM